MRERWECPKCDYTTDLLPGTKFYEHAKVSGIRREVHVMKKSKVKEGVR
jgi:hypothetical protein